MQRAIVGTTLIVVGYIFWWYYIKALQFDWFFYHPWIDIPFHFVGGFLIALVTYFAFSEIAHARGWILSFRDLAIKLILATLFIGLLWEVYELVVGLAEEFNYLQDTLGDLIMDTLGAFAAILFAWPFVRKEHKRNKHTDEAS